jgi:hypothetical protein
VVLAAHGQGDGALAPDFGHAVTVMPLFPGIGCISQMGRHTRFGSTKYGRKVTVIASVAHALGIEEVNEPPPRASRAAMAAAD